MASAQQTVVTLLLSMIQPILIILALALILSAVLASRMAKRIIRPIVNLDLEHPEDCDTYEELTASSTRTTPSSSRYSSCSRSSRSLPL